MSLITGGSAGWIWFWSIHVIGRLLAFFNGARKSQGDEVKNEFFGSNFTFRFNRRRFSDVRRQRKSISLHGFVVEFRFTWTTEKIEISFRRHQRIRRCLVFIRLRVQIDQFE